MATWTYDDMPDLSGTTVCITGANSGIGFEGAKACATQGGTVIMACRSVERGEAAAAEIRETTEAGTLDVRACDLASLDAVDAFVEEVTAAYDDLDVLCNNAGVMAIPRDETEDGFEKQLGVNHLSHFALTAQLFPLLRAADGEARVVTQSSGVHERGEIHFDDLHLEEDYDKWDAYAQSKMANVLFAYELQRRIEDREIEDVISLACHPGYADTNLQGRTASASGKLREKLMFKVSNTLFAQSPRKGALPMLYAAFGDVPGGEYVGPDGFQNMRGAPAVQDSAPATYDEQTARRLWERSEADTGVTFLSD